MRISSTVDLREKEVVNLCDGAKLGCAEDFEFDVCSGKICALVIVCESGFPGFGKKELIIIPWDKIHCIGEDTVLVRLEANELQNCICEKKKKKKRC